MLEAIVRDIGHGFTFAFTEQGDLQRRPSLAGEFIDTLSLPVERSRESRVHTVTWWDNSSFFQSLWGYLALAAIFALGQCLMAWVFLSSPRLTLWFLAAELVLACVVIAARRWAPSGAKALPWCEWPLQGIFALQTVYFAFVFAVGCYWFGTVQGLLTAVLVGLSFAAVLWVDRYKPQWSGRVRFAGSLALTVVTVWISVRTGHSVVLPFVLAPAAVLTLLIVMVSVRRAAAERRSWDS